MNIISRLFGKKKISIQKFESVDSFWGFITQEEKWYLEYSPHQIKDIETYIVEIAPLVIKTTNEIRKKMSFSDDEYWNIIRWDNLLMRKNKETDNDFKLSELKFKQFCPNCNAENTSVYMLRYPKAICAKCVHEVTSKEGRKVEFLNTGLSGYQGYYASTDQKEKYNSDKCYINNKEYIAKEAKFGGIIIQLKN
jgi:hypothetical protein